MTVALSIFVSFLLILGNAYFSAAEMALVNARTSKLQEFLDAGDKRAKKALEVAADSDDLLATIQVFITLLGFFASAVSATMLSDPFAGWMESLGLTPSITQPLATILITLIVSYFSIVVGELLPKRIALADPERVSESLASSIFKFERLARPLVWLTAKSASGLAKILRVKESSDRDMVTGEEIKYIVKDNTELLPDEKRMIDEVIDMRDTTAHDIMTPRTDIVFVEDTETIRQCIERMRGTGFSRLPVYHERYDRIVGVVKYKDLAPALLEHRENEPVGPYAKDAYFVPETKDVFPMLSEMQASRQQMAIVVDEYGGTDGLITLEDIIEEIVGDIEDETDTDPQDVVPIGEDEWLVRGSLPVDDAIDLGFPVTDSENYETIAGWLLDTVDTIPKIGDVFVINGYRFTIHRMRRHRIESMRVKRLPKPAGKDVPDDKSAGRDPISKYKDKAPAEHAKRHHGGKAGSDRTKPGSAKSDGANRDSAKPADDSKPADTQHDGTHGKNEDE